MGKRIALRSLANGRIVCAEGAGSQPLIANRDAVGPWETFELIELDDEAPGPVPEPPPQPQPEPPLPLPTGKTFKLTNQDGIINRTYSYWANAWISGDFCYAFVGNTEFQPHLYSVHIPSGDTLDHGPIFPYTGTAEGWYFDKHGWIYIPIGQTLRMFHPLTREERTVFSIDNEFGPNTQLWQAHSSDDGQTHSATVQRVTQSGPYQNMGTIVYNGRLNWYPAIGSLDESQITSDGRFLIIKEDNDNRIINLETGQERRLTNAQGAVGHSDCGPSFVVGEDDIHGACVKWDLNKDLNESNRLELFKTWNMGHVSVRDNRCLLSTSQSLSLVDMSGSGQGQHLLDPGMTGSGYDFQVHANLSPCGRAAAFVSNSSGRFELYVYLI